MKKLLTTAGILCMAFAVQAQSPENFNPLTDRQFYFDTLNIIGILSGLYIISSFIQRLFKQYYGYRIKNRMLDKGTEENIVKELLQPEKKDNKDYVLQWFCMLASIGAGIFLVSWIRPFGLHSLAILAFSIAAGFGAYFYFSRQTEKMH
ncbi:MAG TPA: hypothetical protein VK772_00880 [Puia sp.]|nr:hypothetical protein [Puia sp.]